MNQVTLTARGRAVAWTLAIALTLGFVYATRDYCWNYSGIGWTKCADLYAAVQP